MCNSKESPSPSLFSSNTFNVKKVPPRTTFSHVRRIKCHRYLTGESVLYVDPTFIILYTIVWHQSCLVFFVFFYFFFLFFCLQIARCQRRATSGKRYFFCSFRPVGDCSVINVIALDDYSHVGAPRIEALEARETVLPPIPRDLSLVVARLRTLQLRTTRCQRS